MHNIILGAHCEALVQLPLSLEVEVLSINSQSLPSEEKKSSPVLQFYRLPVLYLPTNLQIYIHGCSLNCLNIIIIPASFFLVWNLSCVALITKGVGTQTV